MLLTTRIHSPATVYVNILGYLIITGYSQPNTPNKWSQKVAVVWGNITRGLYPMFAHFGA